MSDERSELEAAREDRAFANGFQAGLILATQTEQRRFHSAMRIDDYPESYRERIAIIDRMRAEALKVVRQHLDSK